MKRETRAKKAKRKEASSAGIVPSERAQGSVKGHSMDAKAAKNGGEGRLASVLSKAALAAVAFVFAFTAIKAIVGSYYGCNALFLGAACAAALGIFALAWHLFSKHEAFFIKYGKFFTLGFLVFMGACQMVFSIMLRYTPAYDIGAVFNGAVQWTEQGSFPAYYEYFAMFQNNFGELLLFRAFFGLGRLVGVTDYFMIACCLNCALSLLMMYLSGSIAKKLIGVRAMMTVYCMFLLSLPFYFIAPSFYTDAMTMVFPVIMLRFYIAARERKKLSERIALFILMGIFAGIGFGIKATVLIMLAAVFIDALLYSDAKTWLSMAVCSVLMVLSVSVAVNTIVHTHIGRDAVAEKKIPLTHWIMMSMGESGTYDSADYEFTKSFTDPAERRAAVGKRLVERIKARGFLGMLELFDRKTEIDFCDGTYGLSDCVGCPHDKDTFLHSFLLTNGALHKPYRNICTGVLTALYILLVLSCVFDITDKRGGMSMLAPRIALLGLFLFLMFWEARWRYFSNYVPMIILSAVMGLEGASRLFGKRKARRGASINN